MKSDVQVPEVGRIISWSPGYSVTKNGKVLKRPRSAKIRADDRIALVSHSTHGTISVQFSA